MGKLKGNLFWVLIALVLLAELCVYLLPFGGTVRAASARHASALSDLQGTQAKLERAREKGAAANKAMIEAALDRKAALEREYLRMILLLAQKDEALERFLPFSSEPVLPARVLEMKDKDKNLLRDKTQTERRKCAEDARAAGIETDPNTVVWDWVKIDGEIPTVQMLIFAQKQLYVQQKLVEIMRQPVEGSVAAAKPAASPAEKPLPLVLLINKITFKQPLTADGGKGDPRFPFDPRYGAYMLTIDVSMLPEYVPTLIDRILDCDLPIVMTSYTVERGINDKLPPVIAARVQADRTLVTVRAECAVLDFTVGISRVEFDRQKFPNPESVAAFFKDRTDEVSQALAAQIAKGTLKNVEADSPSLEYVIHPHLTSQEMKCELEKGIGITVYYGTLDPNLAEVKVR